MATIVYLDPEDEITSAANRIRQAPDTRVGLVVPFGSRVATSRINFRLLAREAMVNGRRLDIVAPDASARALAASAGIPVFASVAEYEAALDVPVARDEGPSGAAVAGAAVAAGGATVTADHPDASGHTPAGAVGGFATPAGTGLTGLRPDPRQEAALDAAVRRGREAPAVRKPRRHIPAALVGGVLILLIAIGVAAVAGFLLLPSAEITLTPVIQPVGPVALTVRADPDATAVDENAGIIPAQTIEIPVQASGEFPATGKRVEKTAATGGVRWTNCDPSRAYSIPRGTLVKTASGVTFGLDETVFLPVAGISISGGIAKVKCQSSEVAITASKAGEAGNVDAATIRVIPASYNRTLLRVTNPQATTGGAATSYTRVSKKDVEAALASLQKDLEAQFATEASSPDRVPVGSTGFPETAVLGEATPSVDPVKLVNQEVDSFTLALDATGTMLAVDPSPVEPMAAAQLEGQVTSGYQLVPDSTRIQVGDGTVVDGVITFAALAVAKEVRPVDGAALRQQVLGLSLAEARILLEPYGKVTVVLWPDWVSGVPTLDQRVTLVVAEPVETAPVPTPTPSEAPAPTPDASPDGSPGGDVPSEPLPSETPA